VIHPGEQPLHACVNDGVISAARGRPGPFEPVGINCLNHAFSSIFLLHCLLSIRRSIRHRLPSTEIKYNSTPDRGACANQRAAQQSAKRRIALVA
jgi:gamma-glutamylcysteine synthetase